MTAAVRVLCEHAFAELGVRRVELLHHPQNHASAAVALRARFKPEGLLRSHRVNKAGETEDRVIYSLLNTDRP
jgi:RimJ/RimL family protein N-acetyltransferase